MGIVILPTNKTYIENANNFTFPTGNKIKTENSSELLSKAFEGLEKNNID